MLHCCWPLLLYFYLAKRGVDTYYVDGNSSTSWLQLFFSHSQNTKEFVLTEEFFYLVLSVFVRSCPDIRYQNVHVDVKAILWFFKKNPCCIATGIIFVYATAVKFLAEKRFKLVTHKKKINEMHKIVEENQIFTLIKIIL